MKEFEFILPPLALQEKFKLIVDNINEAKKANADALVGAESLFNSICLRAFRGDLALNKVA